MRSAGATPKRTAAPTAINSVNASAAAILSVNGSGALQTGAGMESLLVRGNTFTVGGSKVVKQSGQDRVTLVAAGITVHEALKAYERLKAEGIAVRVLDAYSVKPIDQDTLRRAARDTGGKLLVVEDHWFEGGLGDAVLDAFTGSGIKPPTVVKLAVKEMPGSGTPAELLHAAGIDADCIARAVKGML